MISELELRRTEAAHRITEAWQEFISPLARNGDSLPNGHGMREQEDGDSDGAKLPNKQLEGASSG